MFAFVSVGFKTKRHPARRGAEKGNNEDCRYWVEGKAPLVNPLPSPLRLKGSLNIQEKLFKYLQVPPNVVVILVVHSHSPPIHCL